MKRLAWILAALLLVIPLYGETHDAAAVSIMEQICHALVSKEQVKVWTNDPNQVDIIRQSKTLRLVDDCRDADILIYGKADEVVEDCDNKTVFVTRYHLLRYYDKAVGAFYWTKGRPQLLFLPDRLDSQNIRLPENLGKYMSAAL